MSLCALVVCFGLPPSVLLPPTNTQTRYTALLASFVRVSCFLTYLLPLLSSLCVPFLCFPSSIGSRCCFPQHQVDR
jgi:hypothetical protein